MSYCPSCISFREDCNPEVEDYSAPCPYYASKEGVAMNEGTKNILRQAGLGLQVDMVEMCRCPSCFNSISPTEFKNELSAKEYLISGLCQRCQDEVFGS